MDATDSQILEKIHELLIELYGSDEGQKNYAFLTDSLGRFLAGRGGTNRRAPADRAGGDRYRRLAGKVFAVCYPDHLYDDYHPTLESLAKFFTEYFPDVNGLHILPERLMSHDDVWPQDLHDHLTPEGATDFVEYLKGAEILDADLRIGEKYPQTRHSVVQSVLSPWLNEHTDCLKTSREACGRGLASLLQSRFASHFNDGGFSQLGRGTVDPRFGSVSHLEDISGVFELMLDYVINHLDVDNDSLESFRRGEDDGHAFIIVSPLEYRSLSQAGTIAKTFRPRPFPLFTGLRKYPADNETDKNEGIESMNRLFAADGFPSLDPRLIEFMAIYFKVENDQGLSAHDGRVFFRFLEYLKEHDIDYSGLLHDSSVQPQQLTVKESTGLQSLMEYLGLDPKYGDIFLRHDDKIFGQKFFIYTTFSESQVDVDPTTPAGFAMVVRDLFSLLESGNLAMLRMDAIKYLWKQIGRRNFDLVEGNKLIEVIRLLLQIASPDLLPLDEINSPDPVVYAMQEGGGFAYLFGQVNAVPAAFNSGSLEPIVRFRNTMEKKCPDGLVLFTMLSTHDGRSVQGLGVDRGDGHVSISQFYDLVTVVEERGGKAKYRTVAVGEIPADTFSKICNEAELPYDVLTALFHREGETLKLKAPAQTRRQLLGSVSTLAGRTSEDLGLIPAMDFFLQWIVDGQTPYELCCTSRSSFSREKPDGLALSSREEAHRLALAQIYVLTLGQTVPAVYFNDLLGLENDFEGLRRSGKPRDLNRHKNRLEEVAHNMREDEFSVEYVPLINAAIKARVEDRSFYPGSDRYEFQPLNDTVFLNHPHARGRHSFILGNILPVEQLVTLDLSSLAGISHHLISALRRNGLQNALADGERLYPDKNGLLSITLKPYGAAWLSPID